MNGKQDTVPMVELDRVKTALGCKTDAEFARTIGVSGSTVGTWKRAGTCPRTAVLAAEGALSKRRNLPGNVFVIATDSPEQADAVASFLKALHIPDKRVVRL